MPKTFIDMKQKLILFLILLSGTAMAQPKRILLLNPTVHAGNGTVVETGAVGIVDGKIYVVKNSLAYSYEPADWDTVINLNGQHLYPGFVAPNTTLGITEIDAIRASNDYHEVGEYNPHVRSIVAYNCESQVIQTVRTNGVLLTQPTPRGGIISGTSSVMVNDCWNWEDGVALENDGIHVNWPASMQGGEWWNENKDRKKNEHYEEHKRNIAAFFEQSLAYLSEDRTEKDNRFEAMRTVLKGKGRVYFHASDLQQLTDVIEFAKKYAIPFPVIVGGYESYLITDRLKLAKMPVMLPRLHSLPQLDDDMTDLPYKLPYLLQQAGVKFCLQNEGDMEAMNARNIPFLAGTAMAYGLTEEEAIRSVSLSPCEIMGLSDKYGSIEPGKSATLFVSRGSAIDMKTSDVTVILVNGKFVPVTNFQTALYLKYKHKYGL